MFSSLIFSGKTSVLRKLEGKDPATTVVNAFELFYGASSPRSHPLTSLRPGVCLGV